MMPQSRDIKQIVIAVTTALILGFGASYLTTMRLLTTFEAEQRALEMRVDRIETEQKSRGPMITETGTELRVLNERLKRFDELEDAVRRVEKKVDRLTIRGEQ